MSLLHWIITSTLNLWGEWLRLYEKEKKKEGKE